MSKNTVHLMVGFMGFGKTTLAKQLAVDYNAKIFTHDDIMCERYGRRPDDFINKYKIVDEYIRAEAEKCIKNNQDVILDYGFWRHEQRLQYYNWAKSLTDNILFHVVTCDMQVAKQRVLERTKTNSDALYIDEDIFNAFVGRYEPWDERDDFPVIFHNC